MVSLRKLFQDLKTVSTGDVSAYSRITQEFSERVSARASQTEKMIRLGPNERVLPKPAKRAKYTLVSDNYGEIYVIPTSEQKAWKEYLAEECCRNEEGKDAVGWPEWARHLDRSLLPGLPTS